MELEALRVSGFRSLALIDWVPIRRPTILTGPNDGGKTSLLDSLRFLLEGKPIPSGDFTMVRQGEQPECGTSDGRYSECFVEGQFNPSDAERTELRLPPKVHVRRRLSVDQAPSLEILMQVPSDERLRALEVKPLQDLRAVAAELDLSATGPGNLRQSYLTPLLARAATEPQEEAWVTAPRDFPSHLPRQITFASTIEPDPRREIQQALQEAYARALEDSSIVGRVREAEEQVRAKLQVEAEELQAHIIKRCPELSDLTVIPSVSFKEGFGGVDITSSRGVDDAVDLEAFGIGYAPSNHPGDLGMDPRSSGSWTRIPKSGSDPCVRRT